MFSGTSPGRNRLLERIWRTLTGWVKPPSLQGQLRSRVYYRNQQQGWKDLEIYEYPIRDRDRAYRIEEMLEWSPEVKKCLNILIADALSSLDGDDIGLAIPKESIDPVTGELVPLDDDVYEVARDTLARLRRANIPELMLRDMLGRGDGFVNLSYDRIGGRVIVGGFLRLPPWEMFRIEDNYGKLEGFEQRRHINDQDAIRFHPLSIAHFRYDQRYLYGRSIWHSSIGTWERMRDADSYLAQGVEEAGVNPTLHMISGGDELFRQYMQDHEDRKASEGVIRDYYMMANNAGTLADVRKLANFNANIDALLQNFNTRKTELVEVANIPGWRFMFHDAQARGARDIAGQPAEAYTRVVNNIRDQLSGSVSDGLLQIIHTQLILDFGERWHEFKDQIRIVYPKLITHLNASGEETNLAEDDEFRDTEASNSIRLKEFVLNGNGHR